MKLLLERLPRCLVVHSKGRVIMAMFIVIALGLQWFCWFRRHPIVIQRQVDIRAVEKLEEEVEKLKRSWSEEEEAAVESQLQKAHEQLFIGDPKPGAWSEEVDPPESLASIAARVKVGEPIPHPRHASSLLIAPTLWDLDLGKSGRPNLTAILEFLKGLTSDQDKRMDLVSLVISGDGRTLKGVELGLDLWFLKEIEGTP
ncbi:MAG: hypothetical protein ACI8T1_001249 [Verrucomicrobiales bacterium]|jgi:hypothetical protein